MNEFAISNGLTPQLALLTSDGVENTSRRNNLSFANLLAPFCTVQVNVNDPSGQQTSFKLQVNLRDIKRNGYLLSFTVLPSVLLETVRLRAQTNFSDDAWSGGFKEFFHYWQEPSSHDFLKSYICCIFAVSTSDPDPIAALGSLIQQQNYQQHGSGESVNSLSAAHCATPKWFLPQILKYYVLVQDISKNEDEKAQVVFASMNSTYGHQFCYHLKINSTENSNMPDPWSKSLSDKCRGLENGLEVARREVLAKNNAPKPQTMSHDLTNISVSSIATVSSDISVTALPLNLENTTSKRLPMPGPPSTSIMTGAKHGDCLDTNDRERIQSFIEHFVKNVLIPFVERQLVTQNEALMNRRGIGKSFTNMKKWLNVASITPQLSSNTINSYTNESPEMQTRRLADLAFLFGLYAYSNQLYQMLKKDFLNDQSWLHHAGALEMAALSSFLSSTPAQLKNYPARYMENAIQFYADTCAQPLLAARCVLFSAEILVYLEKYADAANQIIRIASTLLDIYGAVFLERAATLFGRCKMFRRQAFHLVLAGHRYEKSDLMQLAFQCYKKALPEYIDKNWTNAEDNVLCVVSRDPSMKLEDRIECSQRLIRTFCTNQSKEQQKIFLKNYLRQAPPEQQSSSILVVSDIQTFFGINPTALTDDDLTKQGLSFTPDGFDLVPDSNWTDIERAASQAIFGMSSVFRPVISFANQLTSNVQVNTTPANEPFTVRMKLLNPLQIGFKLKRLRLGFAKVESATADEQLFSTVSEIDELYLPGILMIEASSSGSSDSPYTMHAQEHQIELFCVPTNACTEFCVNSLKFDIIIDESPDTFAVQLPISTRGQKLFSNKSEMSGKVYAEDNRLKAKVANKAYPLLSFQFVNNQIDDQSLEIQTTSLNLFCSQTYHLQLQIANKGSCDIDHLCMAYDHPELLTFIDPQDESPLQVKSSTTSHGVFTSLLNQRIKVGETINLKLIIHAPSTPVNNVVLRLIFLYVSADGVSRRWRHKLDFTTILLLQTEVSVIDFDDKLCALKVRNVINSRDSILVQIECLRLEAKLKSSAGYMADLHSLSNRKIVLDTEQSDMYCFYLRFTKDHPGSILMSDDKSKLYWPYLSKLETDHLQLALTWRAKITRETTSSIYGQSIISNPFICFPPGEIDLLNETAIPNLLIQTRLLRQLVSIPICNEALVFSLAIEECRRQANTDCANRNIPEEVKIPWSIDF